MPEIWGIILTALLSALVGAIGGSWQANRANATKTEVEALSGIIKEYRTERDCDRLEIQSLTNKVTDLEGKLEAERCKRREVEAAKDARISELEGKVKVLEAQLEELEQLPRTRTNKRAAL